MIAKKFKFPLRHLFLRFRGQAKKVSSSHMLLYYRSAKESSLSLIIPKKARPKAVARNRLKRRLYDSLWQVVKDRQVASVLQLSPHASNIEDQALETEARIIYEKIINHPD